MEYALPMRPARSRTLLLANTLTWLGTAGACRRFMHAQSDPEGHQRATLRRILSNQASSRYGLAHGFSRLQNPDDYRAAVPVVDHDDLKPWIDAICRGEQRVLTADPVLMLEKTSGSTAASKYIPYTPSLRREFQVATSAWMHDLLRHRPALRNLGSYWSISPLAREREVTAGGLPVGFEDDTQYFDPLERWILKQMMGVPMSVRDIASMRTNRYVTLRWLLNRDDLGLVSVWNPSFLTLLVEAAEIEGDRLARDLREGTLSPPDTLEPGLQARLEHGLVKRPKTAERIEHALRDGYLLGTELWPDLQLISCWTDSVAALSLPTLRARFPQVEIQGKGLLATEGVVSIPLLGHPGAALALDSHFLEFLPEGASATGTTRLVHELEAGQRYSVLLTTGGGLYRYALHDLIEVVGFLGPSPLVSFVGKARHISDLVGEKLSALRVGQVVEGAFDELGIRPSFAMLAPEWGQQPGYHLFVQWPDATVEATEALARRVERGLQEGHHYRYARDLGQLHEVRVVPVGADAPARYLAGCMELGQRPGDVKPTYLHASCGWRERLLPAQVPAERGTRE